MAKKKTNKKKKDLRAYPPRVENELLKDAENAIDSWRIFKIMSELVQGFEMIRKYDKAATFFGSSRCGLEDDMYKEARELSWRLAKRDFTIITGGGSGVMEAANRGAFQAGGKSVGLNIELPRPQGMNGSVNESVEFHYFFIRKVMLTFASEVYIYFPGGFGTLDEFFELTTLVQTGKINRVPIILYGKEFWSPLTEWFENSLVEKHKTISKDDLDIFTLVDSVDEAFDAIIRLTDAYCESFGGC